MIPISEIERVIAELNETRETHVNNVKLYGQTPELYGRIKELERTIRLLKELLPNETNSAWNITKPKRNDKRQ